MGYSISPTLRTDSIGIPVSDQLANDELAIETVVPLSLSSEEYAQWIDERLETNDTRMVMIDEGDGDTVALQEYKVALGRKLHALIRFRKNRDISLVLLDETDQVTGMSSGSDANSSYIVDNVVCLHCVETCGVLRKKIDVFKNRTGSFERTVRQFVNTSEGIEVGDPLTGIDGILEAISSRSADATETESIKGCVK